jgi:molybdenum cofactor cytidylyltransferase
VVLLADMPAITAAAVDKLIAAFNPDRIVVATSEGRRGNPVLWPRRFFADLLAVSADTGGRRIIEANREAVIEVEIGTPAALDIDTPEALRAVGGKAD